MQGGFDGKKTFTYTLEDQVIHREIILKWILIIRLGGSALDVCGSGQRQEAGWCQHGNYKAGSTKRGEFLDYQIKHIFLEVSAPCGKN